MLKLPTGWIPDIKRDDDLHTASPVIEKRLSLLTKAIPTKTNLQDEFPPVYNQGQTNSCTANAVAALMDYFEQKTGGDFVYPSRMFIYKTTRNLINAATSDSGAYLRSAVEALTLFGAAPESYWPFSPDFLTVEPPPFIYSFAKNYSVKTTYRYDPDGISREDILNRIKVNLAAGIPAAFGFFLFESITSAHITGDIPFPNAEEKGIGGHAVVAVGYDDERIITNGTNSTTGAFRIRNSWGPEWGDKGYGWLPYEYLFKSLAIDWWSVLKEEWFDVDQPIFLIDTSPDSTTTST